MSLQIISLNANLEILGVKAILTLIQDNIQQLLRNQTWLTCCYKNVEETAKTAFLNLADDSVEHNLINHTLI